MNTMSARAERNIVTVSYTHLANTGLTYESDAIAACVIGGVALPKYVLYSALLTALMWVVWNKTKFGKNMFAVGSNEEAAKDVYKRQNNC